MAKGGMRFGAGRPKERALTHRQLTLNATQLNRGRFLEEGGWRALEWNYREDGKVAGMIAIRCEDSTLHLDFAVNGVGNKQRIRVERTPCYFGGERPWLTCPECGKRQVILYFGRYGFACRRCNHLAYATQQVDAMDRSWIKQRKVEARMGGEGALFKPKWMRQTTWQRLRAKLSECEGMRQLALYRFMRRYMTELPEL